MHGSSHRLVLDGVGRIGYDIHMSPFPGAISALLEYIGDPQSYDYIMGFTGAAFRRLWNRDDGSNVGMCHYGDGPFRRFFEAAGYEWHMVPPVKETMVHAIKESLARGVPPISVGIVGPPEGGLVTGYAEDGQILYGWSYFQESASSYYERADWYETMDKSASWGLIVVGDRLPTRPAAREVFTNSLRWAVELERTSRWSHLPNHVGGLDAYEAWASALELDEDYPRDNPEILGIRVMVQGDQCVMLEERHNAAGYLRLAAETLPEVAPDLRAAADLYDAAAGQGQHVWLWGFDMGEIAQQGLADPGTRRQIARHVRQAGASEAEAVAHLERALTML